MAMLLSDKVGFKKKDKNKKRHFIVVKWSIPQEDIKA